MRALGPLERKLLRDLRRLWLQAVAVAAVLGCGIALYVMSAGMRDSLAEARDAWYLRGRMADVAVSLVRAPDALAPRLLAVPGVVAAETRVTGIGLLDLAGVNEPVSAQFLSLPARRSPRVNDVVLRAGRMPARPAEVLLHEGFAKARGLTPGARIDAVLQGRRRSLEVVGIAGSPEFVFAVAPGELLPEPRRFGVVWMEREALGRALDLDGAFNDVVLRLGPGAATRDVLVALDGLLAPHGGRGAYGRDRMLSARYLDDELEQLDTLARILPPVFLLVAVFLLNVALSRLVATERANIGLLKAFGYPDAAVARHYAGFALVFCALGAALGVAGGHLVGRYMASVYRSVYNMPGIVFAGSAAVHFAAVGVAALAALLGAALAVRRSARLPPATALAPPPPLAFGALAGALERRAAALDARTRMVLRRILCFPRRSATTVAGLALALALLIAARQFPLVIERIIDLQFGEVQRMDATLSFVRDTDERVLAEVARLPGVLAVEPLRAADVVLVAGPRRERESLLGVPAGPLLNRIVDADGRVAAPPREGLLLSRHLAERLGVGPGDRIRVEAASGRRTVAETFVAAIADPVLGTPAWMERTALERLLREPGRVSAAQLVIDAARRDALSARAKQLPSVAGVAFADDAEAELRRLMAQGSGFFAGMFVVFSWLMAAGVAFSAARVTLAEQERDLATLRVLGFGRGEASWVLVAEIGLLLAAALPLGILLGIGLSRWIMWRFETDLFSFPHVTDVAAYAQSVLFVTTAVVAATLFVRRGIDRLDLVAVLKSRE